MRLLAILLFCSASAALAAAPSDALETARRLAAAGALQLALDHVTRAQPDDPAAAGWPEWEALRMDLLGRLDRHRDLLARARALPRSLPSAQLRPAYRAALRAAAALRDGPQVQIYAARLLWEHEASADELRDIRLAVIESYLAERRGDDAFLSMLRFEQDYRPLDRSVAARFVDGLLDLGMARQAVNWLASLDDDSALKLRLRVEAALIDSAAALAQARALVARQGALDAWRIIAATAVKQDDPILRVAALEHVLDGSEADSGVPARASELWQAYGALARDLANKHQLLTGDDAGWAQFAVQHVESRPAVARALFGHLVRSALAPESRRGAQARLVASLRGAQLGRAALRLFQAVGLEPAALDARARYLLGEIAESAGEPALALGYWQDLPAPAESEAESWPFRVAAVAVRGGSADVAVEVVSRGVAGRTQLSAEALQRAAAVVRELMGRGRQADAERLFEALLPLAESDSRRQILFSLARINDARGRWLQAADYYLRSAVLAEPKAPDALALQARLAGGLALAQAGYTKDARAQFEWLIRNSTDTAQIELARREIERLKP